MKWENNRRSDQVEDLRAGGGRAGGRLGGKGLGLGSVVVALVAGWLLGVNPLTLLGLLGGQGPAGLGGAEPPPVTAPAPEDPMGRFVAAVLGGTEDTWGRLFAESGSTYVKPRLVLFRGQVATACGTGQSAMGPFYCPGDQKVYIDLGFYDTLRQQLGAPGDFAQAYVIAHEVGHHVQHLMGLTEKMDRMRERLDERRYNALSVRMELQADCFAGIWAHHNHQQANILEAGDVEEALRAAEAIGDDALQRRAQGEVVPDSFTHGTSAQRQRWFERGLRSGQVAACDTFQAQQL